MRLGDRVAVITGAAALSDAADQGFGERSRFDRRTARPAGHPAARGKARVCPRRAWRVQESGSDSADASAMASTGGAEGRYQIGDV